MVVVDPDAEVQRKARRLGIAVLLVATAALVYVGFVGLVAYRRYDKYGTVWADKTPPRIDRCGRRWYPSGQKVQSSDATAGLLRVGSTPGGAPILSERAACPDETMVLDVDLGGGQLATYVLSGGP